MKKTSVSKFIITVVTFVAVLVLILPTLSLLFFSKTNLNHQLLVLALVLILFIIATLYEFIKNDMKEDKLIGLIGLFFAILFFVSDKSTEDLAKIKDFTSISPYNCAVAQGIINATDKELSYSYYNTDVYLQNLGFAYEKFGPETGNSVGQAAYNMVYSNRLLDSITRLMNQQDSPNVIIEHINNMRSQVVTLAKEINSIISCSEKKL